MRIFRHGRKGRESLGDGVSIKLSDELKGMLKYFMESEGINDPQEAITELIKMGYKYWNMRSQYGDNLSDRELWDIRFRLLKLESGYLHYKLMLREALERLRNLTMNLSSALSQLDTCLARLKDADPSLTIDLSESKRLRRFLKEYSEEFIFSARNEVESGEWEGVKDEEVINDIEELLKRYKRLLSGR